MPQRNAPRRSSSFAISSLTTNGSGSCGSVPTCTIDAAALGRRHAGLQRVEVAGDFVADVELRRRQRVAVAVGAQRHVGADQLRLRQRTVEDVGHRDLARAGEPRRHHGHAADGAGAGDQHRLAEQIAAAVDARAAPPPAARRTRARRARCRRRPDSTAARPSRNIRWNMPCTCGKQAGAAEEAHLAAQVLAAFAAVVAAAAGVRRRHRDLVADLDARDARRRSRRPPPDASWPGISGSRTMKLPLRPSK